MLTASLIAAALIGAPFSPRAIVPVASTDVAIAVKPAAFNPTATQRRHTAGITVTPAVAGTLTVVVESGAGRTVATLVDRRPVAAGSTVRATWSGAGAADGTYGVHVQLVPAAGAPADAVAPVVVDTHRPRVVLATLHPSNTASGPVAVRVALGDLSGVARTDLAVASQVGVPIGRQPLEVAADGRSASLRWNLRLRSRLLLPGVFRVVARAVDGAGNVGLSHTRIVRVRRPVKARVIYSVPDAGRVVALTFDDCFDGASMLRIVRAFKAAGAHTTFFCNGVNIAGNASAMRAAVAAGDTIGSHTWSHPQMPRLPLEEQVSQIQGDVDRWWQIDRVSPSPFFRPPYGLFNSTTVAAAGRAGFRWIVLWDVDPSDYLSPAPSVIVQHVASHVRRGSIVVMHCEPHTAAAASDLIAAVRARGLRPVSLAEMLGRSAYLSGPSG